MGSPDVILALSRLSFLETVALAALARWAVLSVNALMDHAALALERTRHD